MTKPITNDEIDSASRLTQQQWLELRQKSGRTTPEVHSADDLTGTKILLNYQGELLNSTSHNTVTVIEKSRRIGATWALAADAVLLSASERNSGGMDTLYIGYNLDMAREFIETCAEWANMLHGATAEIEEFIFEDKDKEGNKFEIQAFRIRFQSGYKIEALTSNPRSLRGRQGFVIIDEAAFHDDLEELLKAAMALLIWGGKVCIISTHDGEDNAFNKLVGDIRAKKRDYSLLRYDFDQAIADGLFERVCMRTGKEWSPEAEAIWRETIIDTYGDGADEELYCIPSKGSGTFLPGALIRARQQECPILRWECKAEFVHFDHERRASDTQDWIEEFLDPVLDALDPNLRHHAGIDFARVADLTVLWPLQVQRNMSMITPFLVELRNVPFENQRQILFHIINKLPRFTSAAVDGGGNGAHLAELIMQEFGAGQIEIVLFSQGFYRDNFPQLKSAFEDVQITVPLDDDVYNDFRAIKKLRGVPQIPGDQRTMELASKGRKRHGDAAIAALLANYSTTIDVMENDLVTTDDLKNNDDDDDEDIGGTVFAHDRSDGPF
jgi:phage FluMu gp28-like protein